MVSFAKFVNISQLKDATVKLATLLSSCEPLYPHSYVPELAHDNPGIHTKDRLQQVSVFQHFL